MATTDTTAASEQLDARKTDWLDRLSELINRIDNWTKAADWSTRKIEKRMRDPEIGDYIAPALILQKETLRILLEPVARVTPGAEGVVDLYLMPAYDDIASLYFTNGDWQLHYMFPGTPTVNTIRDADSVTLSQDSLKKVLEEMVKNADCSLR